MIGRKNNVAYSKPLGHYQECIEGTDYKNLEAILKGF